MKTILLGCGGHARTLLSVLHAQPGVTADVVGILDIDPSMKGRSLLGVPVLGGDELLASQKDNRVDGFINGLGRVGKANNRRIAHERCVAAGLTAVSVISSHSTIAEDVTVGDGAQVLPGAIINTNAVIGEGAVVNTGAIIEHDSKINDHAFIGPGATVFGEVTIGPGAFIGGGAVVLQGLRIGPGAVVGAGAVVLSDVPAESTVVGVPARTMTGRTF